ncbi:Hypothetical protein NTJ_05230 [Nesidiocoris tenuis]|uniref:Uncharacterized protein n=1 Tax=Nesidiocoris tenuis TaxID=355587 RepID=A0ABN7AJI7_9HEMI|nr:Hypothetical protein NTJ_05230 [Nesidiocoris tenuis]
MAAAEHIVSGHGERKTLGCGWFLDRPTEEVKILRILNDHPNVLRDLLNAESIIMPFSRAYDVCQVAKEEDQAPLHEISIYLTFLRHDLFLFLEYTVGESTNFLDGKLIPYSIK